MAALGQRAAADSAERLLQTSARALRLQCPRLGVYLILGARGKDSEDVKPEDFKVFINSTPLTYGGKCDVTPYTRWQGYYFKIEDTSVLDIANVVEISSDGADFDVEYAELRVNASLEKSQWEKDNFAWRNL